MKTKAVRLDEDQINMLETTAKIEGSNVSIIIREGLTLLFNQLAQQDPEFAALSQRLAQDRLNLYVQETAAALGHRALDGLKLPDIQTPPESS